MSYAYVFDLTCSVLAAAAWYLRPELGPWPLLLIAAGRLARGLAGGRSAFRWSAFDLPALLFLASAWLGMRIAYDSVTASAKFWQIAGGLALYGSLARLPVALEFARRIEPARVLLAVLPAVIAAYFLLTNDWLHWTGKLPWLDPAARWLATWQPWLPGHRLHPNVAGGMIAAFMPLQIAALAPLVVRPAGSRYALRLVLAACHLGVSLAGLLLTASRGAWLALAAACLIWWLLPRLVPARNRQARPQSAAAAAAGPVVRSWLAPPAILAGAQFAIPAGVLTRLTLLRNSLDLALDYPFSGLGLGGFQMAYSSYVLLIHVGYSVHSHNMLLDIWIEQGLAGLIALAWFLLAAGQTAWRSLRVGRGQSMVRSLALPALAAILVILLHGMIDDAFYGSRAVLLLFVPFGVLAQEGLVLRKAARPRSGGERAAKHLAWAAVAAAAAVLLLLPGVRAAFQANLGALAQTRAELSVYRWPEWPIQDALRRSGSLDLGPAVTRYRAALALSPGNATANRRLGQLALALGQFDVARQYLERAYQAAPNQRATRQMLGEIYAAEGEPARAAAIWQGIDMGAGQLDGREWWYGHVGDGQASRAIHAARSILGEK